MCNVNNVSEHYSGSYSHNLSYTARRRARQLRENYSDAPVYSKLKSRAYANMLRASQIRQT